MQTGAFEKIQIQIIRSTAYDVKRFSKVLNVRLAVQINVKQIDRALLIDVAIALGERHRVY